VGENPMGNHISQLLQHKNKENTVQSDPLDTLTIMTDSCTECGQIFEHPLLVTDLTKTPPETYYGCPHCLMKINGFDKKPKEKKKEKKPSSLPTEDQKTVENNSPSGCPHHFGYLKNRPKGTPIPEECLTCKKIVQCLT
jgi:DNA-directed RNA polymerase subunit RPC12/RpoP